MIHVSRLVVALAVCSLFCAPLAADVIPSRYADASPARASLEQRLEGLGVASDAAKARVARLSAEETIFFASDERRVQVVGQEMWAGQSNNLWWEWLGGLAALGGVAFGAYVFGRAND